MSREKKAKTIDKLQETFTRSSVSILTDYRGLTTAELTDLRRRLQKAGCDYQVVKNTLARLAVERAGKDNLAGSFEGPTAIAIGYGDITVPAKVLASYLHGSEKSLSIKGGFLGDKLLTPEEVTTLATLPSREVLLAQVLAGMQSPIAGLVNCLATPLRQFIGGLQARIKQLEGE